MIDAVVAHLRCPVCQQALTRTQGSLHCPLGHSFDLAKQGYVELSATPIPHAGDSAEMVADRLAFLTAGHYDFIGDALITSAAVNGLVVDAGVGTGAYLARVVQAQPAAVGLGLDVSKPALRRAAKAHPRVGAVRADLWRELPIADAGAALILNVFAPRNGAEFHRVLRPDGMLLVVTPAPEHLGELISAYAMLQVDPDKADRVRESLGGYFVEQSVRLCRRELKLSAAEVRTLIGMTPSARHIDAASLPAGDIAVTAAVQVTTYRPRED